MQAFFPSSDVMSVLKIFQPKNSILSALMTSLDGKNRFLDEKFAHMRLPTPRE